MRKTFFVLILVIIGFSSGAQDLIIDTLPASVVSDTEGNPITPQKRMQTNVMVGTQFSSSSRYGSGLTTFVSPSISYRVSPRFSVRGGLTLSNTTLLNYRPWFVTEASSSFDANFSKAVIYLEGNYQVTDKLIISGAGFKEFTITDNSNFFNPYSKNEPYGIYLNADYKIAEGVHIQAGFGYTRGYSPYMGSPMYDPSSFSGGSFHPFSFQRDPFNTGPFNW